jgi:hypothetical protein
VTVSRPKRTSSFDSDLYLRGQKKMTAIAAHIDSAKQKMTFDLCRNRIRQMSRVVVENSGLG